MKRQPQLWGFGIRYLVDPRTAHTAGSIHEENAFRVDLLVLLESDFGVQCHHGCQVSLGILLDSRTGSVDNQVRSKLRGGCCCKRECSLMRLGELDGQDEVLLDQLLGIAQSDSCLGGLLAKFEGNGVRWAAQAANVAGHVCK